MLSSTLLFCFLLSSFKRGHASQYQHTVQISSLLPASVCNPSTKGNQHHLCLSPKHTDGYTQLYEIVHPKAHRPSLTLTHRYGSCSQISGGKASTPTLTEIFSQDRSRVKSIRSRLNFNSSKSNFQTSLATLPAIYGGSLSTGDYFVSVGLGTPKNDLSLIFDTGSTLTWTQCQPCVTSCYQQQDPIFDPSMSSTYSNITCASAECSHLVTATGVTPGCSGSTCIYGIQYGDQSSSVGFFGQETLTITSTDVFPGFMFGCGENNQGRFGRIDGLLGLGRDQLSFVSQTAQKYGQYFSYCLPARSSSTGTLTFGNSGAPSNLKFIPMLNTGTTFYFLDLTAIYLGGRELSISPTTFSTAGTIIDSGTVVTWLPPAAYRDLQMGFRQQMRMYPSAPSNSILDTCYDLSAYTTVTVPTVSFLFGGNVTVGIDPSGILYPLSSSQFCLAFTANSAASDVGIFGNFQQKTLEVVYDVAGGKVGFGPGGC
ncbi:hypothetical protein RJ640_002437 [Escallonia rubra]|uniref:Peptidase A1 domain-containing protein n=1 Tax=Escallonia rubra TaxID=112253 RepID=A0AA88RRK1_9ASTE|nr:hypothetical protein RJ640_002437 [Escallonia rubra]